MKMWITKISANNNEEIKGSIKNVGENEEKRGQQKKKRKPKRRKKEE